MIQNLSKKISKSVSGMFFLALVITMFIVADTGNVFAARKASRTSVHRGGGSASRTTIKHHGGGGSVAHHDHHRGHHGGRRDVDVDIDIDVDRRHRRPVARGVAVGTAIAIGTRVVTLPARCTRIYIGDVIYQECSGVYYRPYYEGTTVVYVVVEAP